MFGIFTAMALYFHSFCWCCTNIYMHPIELMKSFYYKLGDTCNTRLLQLSWRNYHNYIDTLFKTVSLGSNPPYNYVFFFINCSFLYPKLLLQSTTAPRILPSTHSVSLHIFLSLRISFPWVIMHNVFFSSWMRVRLAILSKFTTWICRNRLLLKIQGVTDYCTCSGYLITFLIFLLFKTD